MVDINYTMVSRRIRDPRSFGFRQFLSGNKEEIRVGYDLHP
jgi:hypothetical protein